MDEQPVVGRERLQSSAGGDVGRTFGDVDVHADAEVGGQPGGGLQRLVSARERGVDADQPAAAGAQEALVLGETALGPLGAVTVGHAVGAHDADADLGARLGDHVEAAVDGVGALVVIDDPGRAAQQRLDRTETRRRAQHVEVEGGVEPPPDLLEDLAEVRRQPSAAPACRGRASNRDDGGSRRNRE